MWAVTRQHQSRGSEAGLSNQTVNPIFFLIRLPFFLVAFVVWTAWLLLAVPWAALWYFALRPVFQTVGAFFGSALAGDAQGFNSRMEKIGEEWWDEVSSSGPWLLKSYRSMWSWLLHGDKGL